MIVVDIETLAERFPQASPSSPQEALRQGAESDEQKDAFSKIERLVKVRDRSVIEVRNRLHRDGFSSDAR